MNGAGSGLFNSVPVESELGDRAPSDWYDDGKLHVTSPPADETGRPGSIARTRTHQPSEMEYQAVDLSPVLPTHEERGRCSG